MGGVSFPELTVLAKNIKDVEIITGGNSKTKTPTSKKSFVPVPESKQSPHATPSVYANKTHTFPTGNARHTLPREEFDFAANLARFDKASEFKKIQAEDLVPVGDRLVSINSPQRKLGIHENVLDDAANITAKNLKKTAGKTETDEIMDKFKHLTVSKPKTKGSPLLVEDGSSDSEIEINSKAQVKAKDYEEKDDKKLKDYSNNNQTDKANNTANTTNSIANSPVIPMVSSKLFDSIVTETETHRTISSINFAHHLLAELDPSQPIVLLLGVGEASAILMETFYHLTNNSRRTGDVYAIFAAGGQGSNGKRIELSPSVKSARKKLLATEKIKFTTALNEIIKLTDVVVFDALGHDGEMTPNAVKGLTEWMKKLISNSSKDQRMIYGIESSILRLTSAIASNQNIVLVTFGIARDTLVPSLSVSKSILYVDSGISENTFKNDLKIDEIAEIFSVSFVTEIEY